jgi:type IV pilus assembly protein PilY1
MSGAAANAFRSWLLVAAWLAAATVRADSDEAWLQRAALPDGVRPLLALILDRSQATSAEMAITDDYDPARDYGAALPPGSACDVGRMWVRRGTGPLPDCGRQAGVELLPRSPDSGLQCAAARTPLEEAGYFISARAAQWRASRSGGHWGAPDADGVGALECRADRGTHGDTAGDWYAAEGIEAPWSRDGAKEIPWNRPPFAEPYVFFSGNFLNYLRAAAPTLMRPLAETLARRMAAALGATAELDVAILRVDDDGPEGGYVARAPIPSGDAAAELLALASVAPAGSAPLGETLTEAARWLTGGTRNFGLDDRTDPASLTAPGAAQYRSPFAHACRPVSMAYLSAGQSSDDERAAAAAGALPRFIEEAGGCGADCVGVLVEWLGSTDLRDDLPAQQSAGIAWITPADTDVAARTRSYADPLAYLDAVIAAHQRDAAVAANPQLSAAALLPFDSRAGAPGVVFGLTAPRPRERWAGNFLQYSLKAPASPVEPPVIADRDGVPAIGADGLPQAGTRSLWSDAPDANLLTGGAAGRLPSPETRNLFVDLASDRIVDPGNRLEPGNELITRDLLGLGPLDAESPEELLESFRAMRSLGDSGRHAPAIAEYPAENLRVAYGASQDGTVHAFDADSGVELWAWMPKELLARIPLLLRDAPTTARGHGVDGQILLHRHDPDGDGVIDSSAAEHLWLMFGLGRGGPRYYALDVSQPREPRLLWSVELPDAGVLALADPVVARLTVTDSGQDPGSWGVFLAGGYDSQFDARGAGGGGSGGRLLLADAVTGRVLWSAGDDNDDLPIAGLASVAAAPRLLDLDGNGEVDRAYLLDVAGNLWRIDFAGGRAAADLASAHRLAHLGTEGRRFHDTPDAAIVRRGTATALALAFGSGSRMRPRDAAPEDALHVIYDVVTGTAGRDLAIVDLHDVTGTSEGVPPGAPGWILRLVAHGAGEKVAGPVSTFDHVLRFQTYQPLPDDPAAPCGPPRSVARRYAIDIRTAAPRATAVDSPEDEPEEIRASGLPPGLRFGFPGRWEDGCAGCTPRPFAILGGETFDTAYANDPVGTSWRKLVPPVSP